MRRHLCREFDVKRGRIYQVRGQDGLERLIEAKASLTGNDEEALEFMIADFKRLTGKGLDPRLVIIHGHGYKMAGNRNVDEVYAFHADNILFHDARVTVCYDEHLTEGVESDNLTINEQGEWKLTNPDPKIVTASPGDLLCHAAQSNRALARPYFHRAPKIKHNEIRVMMSAEYVCPR